ncbi:winged helix-turn-helix domain-containing protein [Leptolyngbya sp. 7M]|uniref:winged helix-turn-helix domain-containing protein n=1 Tax=Leptolyngbya sp. 7M TaxID=2812896 RepID=UPI001B8ABDA4|nr:winged helix-turn-helix domain-containing protein [Leptolyngbya sp. 7M]QYO66160.1 winged helix-turn-helix domain-containing protein [Leptolyngbya sp. 7M]
MSNNDNNLRRFDRYAIDLERKILWADGVIVDLPVKSVELLCVLVERAGNVVTKNELLDQVWQDAFVEEGVLPQNVYLLRKTFKQYGSTENLIQTVPRRGYRFTGEWTESYPRGTLTIEREFIEQSFEKQTQISESEFELIANELDVSEHLSVASERPNAPSGLTRTNQRLLYFALLSVPVALLVAVAVLFISFQPSESFLIQSQGFGDLKYERITASGRAFMAGLSPDDQNVAYVVHTPDDKYGLFLHHLPTGSETVILEPQELHLFSIQFSADGNYIYYSGQNGTKRNSVYRIPLYGGSPQLVTDQLAHCFSLSPDGEWLALYRRVPDTETHHLDICRSSDCSERRTVASRSNGSGFIIWGASPSWFPDGSKLLAAAFTKDPNNGRAKRNLIEIDLITGKQDDISSPDWFGIHQAYWTKGGSEIILSVRENAGEPVQIWTLKYPSGKAQRITNDANDYREFRPASDLSFILTATWTRSDNLFLIPADDSQNAIQLTFDVGASNGASGIKWTPDGHEIIYTKTSRHGIGNLWRLAPQTMKDSQITFDKSAAQNSIDVSPDGRSVVFGSNRTGRSHIWQIDLDGKNLRQITNGGGEGDPAFSPDGKWLYYGGNGLWKMPVEGGDPVRVLEHTPRFPNISPTDPTRFVAHFYDQKETEGQPYKIGLFTETDPTQPKILPFTRSPFDWKRDGSGIYYGHNGETFGNIWFIPIDGKNPFQITKFTDQVISNFSLSPDGKTFAVSRGSIVGNIIKIQLRNADR